MDSEVAVPRVEASSMCYAPKKKKNHLQTNQQYKTHMHQQMIEWRAQWRGNLMLDRLLWGEEKNPWWQSTIDVWSHSHISKQKKDAYLVVANITACATFSVKLQRNHISLNKKLFSFKNDSPAVHYRNYKLRNYIYVINFIIILMTL